ncbi:granule associated Rac and RHOG effector protein 1-like [Asterias amurensis]|uniref:granule associated Rac and RHOG effector protein 1-like n=1 Tax=Asterias amurensis TaxID=7602 RepID=UPI003AB6ED84
MPIMKSDGSGDGRSRSHFHRSFPNSYHAHVEDVKTQSEDCLMAMNALCRSSTLLAETFVTLFQDTPFVELALRVKQVSQDLAARTLNASEHIQEDGIAMVTRLIGRDSKEKSDEGVQVLARCFLLMLQTQCHFFRSATDAFTPLGCYEEVEDVLIGEQCEDGVREACSSWIAASQATKSLRKGYSLTDNERQLLQDAQSHQGQQVDLKMSEVKQKLDLQLSVYKQDLSELPKTELCLSGGFHLHPQCTSLLMQGCCGNRESQEINTYQSNKLLHQTVAAAGETGQSQRLSVSEQRATLQADLQDVSLQVEGTMCQRSPNQEENFQAKLQAVEALVKETSRQLGVPINQEQVSLNLLCEVCPSVAVGQSRLAVQLLFGREDLVDIKASNLHGNLQKYAQISSHDGDFVVEVPTVWILDQCLWGKAATGQETRLGTVEVVYLRRIELSALLDGRKPSLPLIKVKLRQTEQVSSFPTLKGSSKPVDSTPGSPQGKGFRHTMEKLASKFGIGSGQLSKAPSSEFYVPMDLDQDAEATNHRSDDSSSGQSGMSQEAPNQHKTPVGSSTPKRDVTMETIGIASQRPTMISPTVTITSHPSPTEEHAPWNKNVINFKGPVLNRKGFASDAEIQDVVDMLSGITRPSQTVIGQHLDTFSQGSPRNTTPTPGTNSGNTQSNVGGNWGNIDPNPAKYGNFNPTFQEAEAQDRITEIPTTMISRSWTSQPQQLNQLARQPPVQGVRPFPTRNAERDIVSMYDNSSTDAEFAQYIATNFLGKRTKGYAKDLDMAENQGQWVYPDSRLNRTWPLPPEGNPEGVPDHLSHSFSGQHDSGSSSDESAENGDIAFATGLGLTGPNFVASVNRRRHSSGGEEVIHGRGFDPSAQIAMKYLEVAQMELKGSTKTWPPKVLWQRPVTPNDGASPTPGPYPLPAQEQLHVHAPLTPQWSDPVTLRQSSMWPPTGGSTPVSPAGSMTRLAQSQPVLAQSQPVLRGGGAVGGIQGGEHPRGHPKLDRKYAYSQY